MRVIDSHVHFPAKKFIDDGKRDPIPRPASDREMSQPSPKRKPAADVQRIAAETWLDAERASWRRAWRFPDPVEVDEAEAERLWLAETERYEYLERVVFVTTGRNELAVDLSNRHPEVFIGYAHHDPTLPDAADRLEKAIAAGLKGYKLLAPRVEAPIGDRTFYPLWEIARDAGVPVLIHFGIEGGAGGIASHQNINPLSFHGVAKDFPDLRIIIPHFGCGYLFETLNLCWACPNVSIDTSGSNQWMRWMPYEVTLESLFRKYRETIGPSRILFGSDSSWFPRGFATAYLDEQVRAMTYVGYSPDDLDAVLYRNAAAILGL
jgi:uncharacterized protein